MDDTLFQLINDHEIYHKALMKHKQEHKCALCKWKTVQTCNDYPAITCGNCGYIFHYCKMPVNIERLNNGVVIKPWKLLTSPGPSYACNSLFKQPIDDDTPVI